MRCTPKDVITLLLKDEMYPLSSSAFQLEERVGERR
jgi:hypothetical protein